MLKTLKVNTKLYSFDGVISRYDFFLNYLYIVLISSFVNLPYQIYLGRHITSLSDLFNFGKIFLTAPIGMQLWQLITVILVSVLFCSNIFRRLNDINGKVSSNVNILCAAIYLISALSFFAQGAISYLFYLCILINLFIMLYLFSKKGAVTSKCPPNNNKKFNWGAFFGTWIWGLFNKSYIPLFMLILFFTPASLTFALICGFKGNEWAFKNKNPKYINKFNSSQRKQAIIFGVLAVFALPCLLLGLFAALFAKFSYEIQNDPEFSQKINYYVYTTKNNIYSEYFVNHEILENENRFYVQPNKWNNFSFSDKTKILDMASNLAAEERNKMASDQNSVNRVMYTKSSEISRTKIYNAQNRELLGEFIYPQTKSSDFKEIFNEVLNGYKFYNAT